ncbi:MAG: hypothetical protein Q4B80_04390, partial [Aerococcaceae bacterium]|nr:hypothetical protein [Aerococcaceae bacterium]
MKSSLKNRLLLSTMTLTAVLALAACGNETTTKPETSSSQAAQSATSESKDPYAQSSSSADPYAQQGSESKADPYAQ